MKRLIKGAKIITMGALGTLEKADILMEDGKITAIGEGLEALEAEVIDAKGLTAIPGIVDAHSHIGGFEIATGAQDVNEMVKNVTAEVEVIDGLDPRSPSFKEALAAGVTCSAIAPGSGNVIGGVVCAVKSAGQGTIDSMCINRHVALKAAMGGNPKGVYGKRNQMPMTRMGVASILRQYFRDVQEYMKKQEEAKSDPAKMPKWDPAMENGAKVLRHEMPVKMHCTQFDMITVIELAKEFDFEFTLDHAWGASDYMEPIVESGCPVIFGPIAVAKGFGESIKIDIDSVVEMDKRGVLCSIMTDGPVYHPWLIVEQAGEVVRYGADVERAIAMLTINPAKTIGCDQRIGSLEIGKDADIAIFNGMPFSNLTLCEQVIIDGKREFTRQQGDL